MFTNVTPEEIGISSVKVLEYVKLLENYKLKTHSILMARGKKIFAETYYAPFDKNFKHRMYSVSKSFITVAIGLAEQDGLLSLDDKLMDYFPEYRNENVSERFEEATIREMLSMQTFMVDYVNWWGMPDRVAAYFTKPSNQISGTNFFYDSAGSFLLGCLVEKLTGKPFLEYLKEDDCRSKQNTFSVGFEPVGQELGNCDGVICRNGKSAEIRCNENPGKNRSDEQTDCDPDLSDTGKINCTGQTHKHPGTHIRCTGRQGRDPAVHVSVSKEVSLFSGTGFSVFEIERDTNGEQHYKIEQQCNKFGDFHFFLRLLFYFFRVIKNISG